MSTSNETAVIRAWIARKENKGLAPNADEVWARINSLWPTLTEEDREWIFQSATGKKRK